MFTLKEQLIAAILLVVFIGIGSTLAGETGATVGGIVALGTAYYVVFRMRRSAAGAAAGDQVKPADD